MMSGSCGIGVALGSSSRTAVAGGSSRRRRVLQGHLLGGGQPVLGQRGEDRHGVRGLVLSGDEEQAAALGDVAGGVEAVAGPRGAQVGQGGVEQRLDDPAHRQPHRVGGLGHHGDLRAQVLGQLRVARFEQVGRLGGGGFADGPPDQRPHPAAVQFGGQQVGGDDHGGALAEDPVVARVDRGEVDRGGLDHGVGALVGGAQVPAAGDGRPAQLGGPAGGGGGVEHQDRAGVAAAGTGERGELEQVGLGGAAQQRTGGGQHLVHQVGAGLAGLGRGEGAGRVGQR